MIFARLSFALSILALAACAPARNQFQNPANRADGDIRNSFGIVSEAGNADPSKTGGLGLDKTKITIEKSALEKEFLLQPSLIIQPDAPAFQGMKSRVVFFRQVENHLYLIEASKGLLLAKNYPQTLLLAEFPILSENGSTITFDFNAGMKRLFVQGDWAARDFGLEGDDHVSVKAAIAYVDRASFTSNNALEIHQVAQLELPYMGAKSNLPVEVEYYLQPYKPNPNFKPSIAPKTYDRMGFFEVMFQYNDDSGYVSYASKHDISKPIEYAISANTPAEYKDAVRDGILYWNKAFGTEVIKVVDGPANTFAPNPNYNIVQWVDWPSAGGAFADAQMDPRTGEILHQQIYFTSAWALIGSKELQSFDRMMPAKKSIGLKGFTEKGLCDLDVNEMASSQLSKLTTTERDPAKLRKAVKDLIREVVAHEVGHTLGMRHNFAGSLAANYPVETRDQLFKDYLDTENVKPGLVTSSSVMDYQFPMEAMMTGDQIVKRPEASDYDTKAIQALYYGKHFKASELPLFCTDSHTMKYADCQRYDIGNSYVAWLKYWGHSELNNLPYRVLEKFILAKAPLFGMQPTEISEVELDPKMLTYMMMYRQADFRRLLTKDAKFLSTERKFSVVGPTNAEAAREKAVDFVSMDLARNGELEKVLLNTSDVSPEALSAKFETLLADPRMVKGETSAGVPYEFTADELVTMKETAKAFFNRLKIEMADSELRFMAGEFPVELPPAFAALLSKLMGTTTFVPSPLADKYAQYLGKRVQHFLFATNPDPMIFKRNVSSSGWATVKNSEVVPAPAPQVEAQTLTVPRFTYSLALRKKAAGTLAATRSESPYWAFDDRRTVQKAYQKMVNDALPGITAKEPAALEAYPRDLVAWILDSQQVESTLGTPGATPTATVTVK